MYRDSRVISKVQAPKIRVIHLLPPKIHHADVADFRDLVQRLTGKNGGKVKGKGKKVKQEQEDMTTIRCDNPTVIVPKVEAEMMGTLAGSSSSSDHHQDLDQHHHWRPSLSSSSSGDDHNNMFSGGGCIPTLDLEVDDDGFDFTSLFNFDDHDRRDQSSSGDDDHNNDVLSGGGYLSTFYQVDNDDVDLNSFLIMGEENLNPFGDKFN